MSEIISEIEQLRVLYKEIIDGYSYVENLNLYIKHLNDLEYADVTRVRQQSFNKYKEQGIFSHDERVKYLIETEQWSQVKEDEIIQYQYIISDNEANLKKIIPIQHGPILFAIKEVKDKLSQLQEEKRSLIGGTANSFSERESYSYLLYLSLYKDKELSKKYFDGFSELEGLDESNLIKLHKLLDSNYLKFSDENIRKISVLPFFLNVFSYAKDSIHTFLDKPIAFLSTFQVQLFSLGSRNINILSQTKGSPPSLIGNTSAQDIVDWYDRSFSVLFTKSEDIKN